MIKKLSIILMAFIASISLLTAQEKEEAKKEPTVDVTIKFFRWAFSNKMSIPLVGGDGGSYTAVKSNAKDRIQLYYKVDDGYRPLEIKPGTMSKPYRYVGPKTMVLYTESESSTKEKPLFKPYSKLEIPVGIDQFFAMMFVRGASIRFYPMNVSPKTLPKEKVAIINMTSERLALSVGGKPSLLAPGGNSIFTPEKKKGNSVELKLARMIDEKWKPVYQNLITPPQDARCIVLIYDPFNKKTPKFNVQILSL